MSQIFKDVRWLFFDVGSTLMDETAAHDARAPQVVDAMAELGVSITMHEWAEAYEDVFSWAPSRMFEHAVRSFGLSQGDGAVVRGKTTFECSLEVPYTNARQTVDTLARYYRLGIIANQSPRLTARLRSQHMAQYFHIVLGSGDVGLSKPDPEIFQHALMLSGCLKGQAVMIGDSTGNDIVPAKALGMKTIRIRQGFTSAIDPASKAERPDANIEAIADLVHLLGR